MSIKIKIVIILMFVVLVDGVLDFANQRLIVFPSFLSLERSEAEKDMERCVNAVRREIEHLDKFVLDWSAWDHTYEFVAGVDTSAYVESNLPLTTFVSSRLNLVYFYDTAGAVVWGAAWNLTGEEPEKIRLAEFPPDTAPLYPTLLEHSDVLGTVNGVLATSHGPMIFAARPIITSEEQGPIRGTLIMGRFLDARLVATLADQTRTELRVLKIDANLDKRHKWAVDNLAPPSPHLVSYLNRDTLRVYTKLHDFAGRALLLLYTDIPRTISRKGEEQSTFALFSILTVGLLAIAILFVLLQKTVIGPIEKLSALAGRIGRTDGNPTTPIPVRGNDEIAVLTAEFNSMMERLSKSRSALQNEVAEKEKTAQALRASESKLEGLVNAITDCMYMVDADMRIVWANDRTKDVFGKNVVGATCHEAIHASPAICRDCITRKTFLDGYVHEHEKEIVVNGVRRTYWCTSNVTARDTAGQPLTVLEILRDVTSRKEAEVALQKSERFLEETLNAIGDGVAVIDGKYGLLRINPALERMFGAKNPITGCKCHAEFFGLDGPCPWCPAQKTLAAGVASTNVAAEVDCAGTKTHLEITTFPRRDERGNVVGVIEYVKDIGMRIRMQAQMERAKRLQSVGTLATGVAHEINQPLNILKLTATSLERLIENEREIGRETLAARLRDLTGEVDRISGIVNHMRALASRDFEPKIEPTDLNRTIRNSASLLAAQLDAHGIRLVFNLDPADPTAVVDPLQLEHVVINIVANAMQALDRHRVKNPEIEISTHARGDAVVMEVADNGPGLGDNIDLIFDPFFTTREAGGGMGLGLSIVYTFVSSWDGTIEARNRPSGGALFKSTMKIYRKEA